MKREFLLSKLSRSLYLQWAAVPSSAISSISSVLIWNSTRSPPGTTIVVSPPLAAGFVGSSM